MASVPQTYGNLPDTLSTPVLARSGPIENAVLVPMGNVPLGRFLIIATLKYFGKLKKVKGGVTNLAPTMSSGDCTE